ncbi:hypothetical protein PFLG_01354 [Plasmodium falciparum RAJ116]|uniref:Uncharacterized protein n=1 Tax=Plasmodium falciparum RAJ116 TaxID=580058 RepID=A0A0L0CUD9_PLAFA|nr:hypothetical protein PFLG_01354 [Plasmodium falciparum RAJ116]
MDLYSFQLTKSLLISLFLTKYLKMNMSRSSWLSHNNNEDFHIGLKQKVTNINEIKERYQNRKMLINKYSNLIMIKIPYSFINIYIYALEANIKSSYKKIPPFCFENISIFLNPDYEVVRNHPFFLSLQEKIKK